MVVAIGSTIRLARVNERSKVSTVEFKEQKIEAEREGERTSIKFPYFECQIRNQMETVGIQNQKRP